MSRISLYEKCKRFVEGQSEGTWPEELVKRDTERMVELVLKEKRSAKRTKKALPKADPGEAVSVGKPVDFGHHEFADSDTHFGPTSIEQKFIDETVDSHDESTDNDHIEEQVVLEGPLSVTKHASVEDFAPATPVDAPYFLIDEVPDAPARRRGGRKDEKFPFSKLEVGQGFAIPVTEKYPEPWKSYVSTVNSRQRKFGHVDGTKVRKLKDGSEKTVDNIVYTRRFIIFRHEFENGTVGAVVKRTQ